MVLTNAMPYSPITKLNSDLLIGETETTVVNASKLPDAPFYAVVTSSSNMNYISTNPNEYETIFVGTKTGGTLSEIVRGIEGAIQNWGNEDFIACFFTAAAYMDFKKRIEENTVIKSNTEPDSANEGQFWLDTSDGYYQGTIFEKIMPVGGDTGDVLTKISEDNYDTNWQSIADLDNATNLATANTIIKRDNDGRARVSAPDHNDDIARKLDVDAKVSKSGDTLTGNIDFNNNKAQKLHIEAYKESCPEVNWDSASVTVNWANTNAVEANLSTAITSMTFSNIPTLSTGEAWSGTIILHQHSSAVAIVWDSNVKWTGGDAPSLDGDDKTYIVTFFKTAKSSDIYGIYSGGEF